MSEIEEEEKINQKEEITKEEEITKDIKEVEVVEEKSNPFMELIFIVVLTIIYYLIMSQYVTGNLNGFTFETYLNKNTTYISPNTSSNNSSSTTPKVTEITRTDYSYEQIIFECPQAILLDEEIEIVENIIKSNILETTKGMELVEKVQEFYDTLEFNVQIRYVELIEEDKISITGHLEGNILAYEILYTNSEDFSKVINTIDQPTEPYYLNNNNLVFTKVLFP